MKAPRTAVALLVATALATTGCSGTDDSAADGTVTITRAR